MIADDQNGLNTSQTNQPDGKKSFNVTEVDNKKLVKIGQVEKVNIMERSMDMLEKLRRVRVRFRIK
jgi:hypothetical protein